MNILQTNYNGKMPLELDDIRWEQAAVREAFYGLMSAFGISAPDSFKISGAAVTIAGNDYTVSDGFISLNGEILRVVAHTITKNPSDTVKFEVAVTYDPSGLEVFQDGSSHDTYEIRRAVLQSVAAVYPATFMAYNASYLIDIIREQVANDTRWINVGGVGAAAFNGSWANKGAPDSVCSYRKDDLGNVYLKGVAAHPTGSNGEVFTLPTGYRPNENLMFTTSYYGTVVCWQVASDGKVYVNTLSTTEVVLDGTIFKV